MMRNSFLNRSLSLVLIFEFILSGIFMSPAWGDDAEKRRLFDEICHLEKELDALYLFYMKTVLARVGLRAFSEERPRGEENPEPYPIFTLYEPDEWSPPEGHDARAETLQSGIPFASEMEKDFAEYSRKRGHYEWALSHLSEEIKSDFQRSSACVLCHRSPEEILTGLDPAHLMSRIEGFKQISNLRNLNAEKSSSDRPIDPQEIPSSLKERVTAYLKKEMMDRLGGMVEEKDLFFLRPLVLTDLVKIYQEILTEAKGLLEPFLQEGAADFSKRNEEERSKLRERVTSYLNAVARLILMGRTMRALSERDRMRGYVGKEELKYLSPEKIEYLYPEEITEKSALSVPEGIPIWTLLPERRYYAISQRGGAYHVTLTPIAMSELEELSLLLNPYNQWRWGALRKSKILDGLLEASLNASALLIPLGRMTDETVEAFLPKGLAHEDIERMKARFHSKSAERRLGEQILIALGSKEPDSGMGNEKNLLLASLLTLERQQGERLRLRLTSLLISGRQRHPDDFYRQLAEEIFQEDLAYPNSFAIHLILASLSAEERLTLVERIFKRHLERIYDSEKKRESILRQWMRQWKEHLSAEEGSTVEPVVEEGEISSTPGTVALLPRAELGEKIAQLLEVVREREMTKRAKILIEASDHPLFFNRALIEELYGEKAAEIEDREAREKYIDSIARWWAGNERWVTFQNLEILLPKHQQELSLQESTEALAGKLHQILVTAKENAIQARLNSSLVRNKGKAFEEGIRSRWERFRDRKGGLLGKWAERLADEAFAPEKSEPGIVSHQMNPLQKRMADAFYQNFMGEFEKIRYAASGERLTKYEEAQELFLSDLGYDDLLKNRGYRKIFGVLPFTLSDDPLNFLLAWTALLPTIEAHLKEEVEDWGVFKGTSEDQQKRAIPEALRILSEAFAGKNSKGAKQALIAKMDELRLIRNLAEKRIDREPLPGLGLGEVRAGNIVWHPRYHAIQLLEIFKEIDSHYFNVKSDVRIPGLDPSEGSKPWGYLYKFLSHQEEEVQLRFLQLREQLFYKQNPLAMVRFESPALSSLAAAKWEKIEEKSLIEYLDEARTPLSSEILLRLAEYHRDRLRSRLGKWGKDLLSVHLLAEELEGVYDSTYLALLMWGAIPVRSADRRSYGFQSLCDYFLTGPEELRPLEIRFCRREKIRRLWKNFLPPQFSAPQYDPTDFIPGELGQHLRAERDMYSSEGGMWERAEAERLFEKATTVIFPSGKRTVIGALPEDYTEVPLQGLTGEGADAVRAAIKKAQALDEKDPEHEIQPDGVDFVSFLLRHQLIRPPREGVDFLASEGVRSIFSEAAPLKNEIAHAELRALLHAARAKSFVDEGANIVQWSSPCEECEFRLYRSEKEKGTRWSPALLMGPSISIHSFLSPGSLPNRGQFQWVDKEIEEGREYQYEIEIFSPTLDASVRTAPIRLTSREHGETLELCQVEWMQRAEGRGIVAPVFGDKDADFLNARQKEILAREIEVGRVSLEPLISRAFEKSANRDWINIWDDKKERASKWRQQARADAVVSSFPGEMIDLATREAYRRLLYRVAQVEQLLNLQEEIRYVGQMSPSALTDPKNVQKYVPYLFHSKVMENALKRAEEKPKGIIQSGSLAPTLLAMLPFSLSDQADTLRQELLVIAMKKTLAQKFFTHPVMEAIDSSWLFFGVMLPLQLIPHPVTQAVGKGLFWAWLASYAAKQIYIAHLNSPWNEGTKERAEAEEHAYHLATTPIFEEDGELVAMGDPMLLPLSSRSDMGGMRLGQAIGLSTFYVGWHVLKVPFYFIGKGYQAWQLRHLRRTLKEEEKRVESAALELGLGKKVPTVREAERQLYERLKRSSGVNGNRDPLRPGELPLPESEALFRGMTLEEREALVRSIVGNEEGGRLWEAYKTLLESQLPEIRAVAEVLQATSTLGFSEREMFEIVNEPWRLYRKMLTFAEQRAAGRLNGEVAELQRLLSIAEREWNLSLKRGEVSEEISESLRSELNQIPERMERLLEEALGRGSLEGEAFRTIVMNWPSFLRIAHQLEHPIALAKILGYRRGEFPESLEELEGRYLSERRTLEANGELNGELRLLEDANKFYASILKRNFGMLPEEEEAMKLLTSENTGPLLTGSDVRRASAHLKVDLQQKLQRGEIDQEVFAQRWSEVEKAEQRLTLYLENSFVRLKSLAEELYGDGLDLTREGLRRRFGNKIEPDKIEAELAGVREDLLDQYGYWYNPITRHPFRAWLYRQYDKAVADYLAKKAAAEKRANDPGRLLEEGK